MKNFHDFKNARERDTYVEECLGSVNREKLPDGFWDRVNTLETKWEIYEFIHGIRKQQNGIVDLLESGVEETQPVYEPVPGADDPHEKLYRAVKSGLHIPDNFAEKRMQQLREGDETTWGLKADPVIAARDFERLYRAVKKGPWSGQASETRKLLRESKRGNDFEPIPDAAYERFYNAVKK